MEVGSRLIAMVCLLFISAELLMVSRAEQGVLSQAHALSLKATSVNCVSQLSTVVSFLKSIDASVNRAWKKAKTTKVKQLLTSAKLELSQAQTWVNQYKFSNAMVNVGKANRNLVTAYSLVKLVDISATLSPIKTINSTLNTLIKYCLPIITPCPTPSPAKTPTPSTVNCVTQLSTVVSYLKSINASVNRAGKKAKTTKVRQLLTSAMLERTRAQIWVNQFRFSDAMVNVGNLNRYLAAAYSAEKLFDISATFTPLRTLYNTLSILVKYCIPISTPCATPSPAKTPTSSTPSPVPVSPAKPSPVPVVHTMPGAVPVVHPTPSPVPVVHPTPSPIPVVHPTPSPVPVIQPTPSPVPVVQPMPSPVPVVQPTPSLVPVDQPTTLSPRPASQSTPSVAPTPR